MINIDSELLTERGRGREKERGRKIEKERGRKRERERKS